MPSFLRILFFKLKSMVSFPKVIYRFSCHEAEGQFHTLIKWEYLQRHFHSFSSFASKSLEINLTEDFPSGFVSTPLGNFSGFSPALGFIFFISCNLGFSSICLNTEGYVDSKESKRQLDGIKEYETTNEGTFDC